KKLNSAVFPGQQGGPLMHVIAAKAVAFAEADTTEFRFYMFEVRGNAQMSADIFKERGYKVVSGGTENHMFLVDFTDADFSGADAERWLGQAGIVVNKNTVPGETRSPAECSGIRIGLAALTTRGATEFEVDAIMNGICDILDSKGDAEVISRVKQEVINIAINLKK
ncbi:MAG: serine hydroxymethyltransferase, partial [Plesiomonas sp.]